MANKRPYTTPTKDNVPRKLWAPATKSPKFLGSPPSSSSSENMELSGFIVVLGFTKDSSKGNKYFDVKFKNGHDNFVNIRVMQAFTNSTVGELFKEHKNKAVKITVSKSGDMLFYNESRRASLQSVKNPLEFNQDISITPLNQLPVGQVAFIRGSVKWQEDSRTTKNNNLFRKLGVTDGDGEVVVTLWNADINRIEEEKWYIFTNMDHSMFDSKELVCSKQTVVEQVQSIRNLQWKDFFKQPTNIQTVAKNDVICCPRIISVKAIHALLCPICGETRPDQEVSVFV